MRVRELVEPPGPNLSLLAGAAGLDRDFEAVTVTDLPDPTRYLRGGELVRAGLMWLADQRGPSRPFQHEPSLPFQQEPSRHGPSQPSRHGPSAARCEVFVGAVARGG